LVRIPLMVALLPGDYAAFRGNLPAQLA